MQKRTRARCRVQQLATTLLQLEGRFAGQALCMSVPRFAHFSELQEALFITNHQKEHAQGPPVQARHL
jgi:hypothetical protein